MQFQENGKNALIFVFVLIVSGLITGNNLFYLAAAIIAAAIVFDLMHFVVAIDSMEASIIRKTNTKKLFIDNIFHVELDLKLYPGSLKHIYFQDIIPDAFSLNSGETKKSLEPGKSEHSISYTLRAVRRGTHSFSVSYLYLDSNIGMFKHKISLDSREEISVFPPVLSRKSLISRYVSSKYGSGRSNRRGTGIEVADIRKYMPGDDVRHIDWKTSLRLKTMFTKEYEADIEMGLFVLVDHSKSENPGNMLDHAVRTANYLTQQASKNSQQVGMITFTQDRITNQVLLRNSKNQYEILNNLFSLSPGESSRQDIVMDSGEINQLLRKLRSHDKDEFYSILAPFFEDNSHHLKIMETKGVFQAIKRVIDYSKTPSIIAIITELAYESPLLESIRLATYHGNKVILIVISVLLFREYDLHELEKNYPEYMKLQKNLEKFRRMKSVKVVEMGAFDRPEQLIDQAVSGWKTHY